jgi:carboxyl-terminal processing protease
MRRGWVHGVIAATLLLATAGRAAAQEASSSPVLKRSAYEDLQMFGQVLNQIRVNHPDSLDMHELFMAAVQGMIHAADPHSYVVPAVRLDAGKEEARRNDKLHPVPISFRYVGGAPVVVSVAAGTAAGQLDILPGDELVSVDGAPVSAASAMELEIVLSGPKKSTVKLGFERRRADGSSVHLERDVRRESYDEDSAVPVSVMMDSATGYVRVTTFMGEKVADDLHSALDRLEKQGMKRLVLDLRDNGGGSVSEAARVAGEFLPRGTVVYTSDGRKADVIDTGRVQRSFWRSERRYPIVVMVNSGTASASELVAGALQDHDRAMIVGRPTFGKSLLMRGFPMSDGSVLVLVVGRVRTPCGRIVQRQYRSITRRDYYRMARAERDTAGRPSCKTDAGRTVYGGGGIFPDLPVSEPTPAPRWMLQLDELQVPLAWSGSYVTAQGATLTSLDDFAKSGTLPAAAVADFRQFAAKQGVVIPTDPAATGDLQHMLVERVAETRWGAEGFYRVSARQDAAVREAMGSFERAGQLLGKSAP